MANTSNNKSNQSKGKNPAPKKQPAKKPANGKGPALPETRLDRQKTAIVLVAFGILAACIVLFEGESGWTVLHNFVSRLFGYCEYLLPITILYIAVVCALDKPNMSLTAKVISTVALNLFACSSFHIIGSETEYLNTVSLGEQIKDIWLANGTKGGITGALIGGIICKIIGKTGATIITIILLLVFLLLVTGLTLPVIYSYIKRPVKKIGQVTNDKFEENARRREELREQQQREEEERERKKNALPPTVVVNAPSGKKVDNLIPKDPSKKAPDPVVGIPVTPVVPVTPVTPVVTDTEVTVTEASKEEKPAKKIRKKTPPEAPKAEEPEKPDENKFVPPADDDKPKGNYTFPSIECLEKRENGSAINSQEEMTKGAQMLIETLQSFKINATVTNICRGPSVTRYELMPEAGVRISKITTLADDIALRLAAQSIRMEAPIPGKSAIGIEVPNSSKSMVSMRELVDTDQYRAAALKSKLSVALGKDITGNLILADLAKMPHLLVAGTTGSGKSVCLNSMIISILYNASPDEVKLLMIDPKQVEFTVYNGIAHLAVPVVSNPRKAAGALSWAVSEMEKRYAQFAANGVRDIKGFNKLADNREDLTKMHHIVIFIDELSDLMMASPKEVEDSICRLAQMARAAGIHLIIATQRPSVDVITGIIKANIPSRIALYVSSGTDSRTIIDQNGAEKLLGNGDMLFSPVGAPKPTRVQGCYISDEEVEAVVNHIKSQSTVEYDDDIMKEIEAKAAAADGGKKGTDDEDASDLDPMFNQAAEVVIMAGQASTTMLQKKLKLGYARASRVMDELEENGIVGPSEGAKPRQVLLTTQEWYERQALASGSASNNKDEQIEFDTLDSYSEEEETYEYDEYEEDLDEDEDEEEYAEEEYEDDEPEEIEINFIPEEITVEPEEKEDDFSEADEPVEIDIFDEPVEPQETYYEKIEEDIPQYEEIDEFEEYEEDNPIDVDYIFEDEDDDDDDDIDTYFN